MKLLFLFLVLSFPLSALADKIWVNGYTRSNGTYVRGHYRSTPDSTKTNNLGLGRYIRSDYGSAYEATTRDSDNDGIYNQFDRDDNNDGYSDDYGW